ncbi:scavenger receptor cysteine-rich type 1 protein M130-like [Scomber japonicus]|uniref:scavenger receptor cysteine-rich type 1 protein M130-like n=1 Tax=Scomber japonicus TaxID=13676 RepID=UPI0023062DEA|nr:scavenger receptor cysteine-rich type 1 protein M130-like [Scomber japonicus]
MKRDCQRRADEWVRQRQTVYLVMDLLLMLLLLLWSSGLQAEDKHQSTVGSRKESSDISLWEIRPYCLQAGSTLRDCASSGSSSSMVELTCSDSVRLVNGTSLCSGRLEVKSEQSWSSVCEADFDQQDAEVVCRELGCGAPSVLQGALYGEVEAPTWTKEFQCGGNESALLDCRRSDSVRRTCSPGKAVGLTCSETVRLVGGASRCAGTLEVKQGEWRPVDNSFSDWNLKQAAVACRELDCGSVVSTGSRYKSLYRPAWWINSYCLQSGSTLRDCVSSSTVPSSSMVELTCSDSVRLVNGASLCSGRLEVKSEQSWSSVCEADFDQQDAEVVCRELDCGAPSVLQGALYGEVEAPMWTKEFQCGGNESALLDCRRSDSARRTCSPGKAVGLTCSEPVRLVGGASRCAGTLEMKHGEWRPVSYTRWTLKEAAVVCRELDCGSAVSAGSRDESSDRPVWRAGFCYFLSGSALRDCASSDSSSSRVELTCSDSVRLVNGTSLCSGRLEVKSEQSWSSVCEADFDQQDAEVVCRELDCGAPSVLQGALYGEVEAPMWTKEFQCGGHESALQDCRRSDSARRTCSPGKAVGLTCSETVRLVGGASRCAGTLEVKQGEWRPVDDSFSVWTLKEAAVACRELDCGSAVSTGSRKESSDRTVWRIEPDCLQSGSALRDCALSYYSSSIVVELTCSDSVRLVNGASLCSGRLEVKSERSWSSVCEADFDQQDAEVVCRELGCGAPSVLQGALYGEMEAQIWTKEFQCGGNESALLDCRRSDSARRTCSPGKAVGLTCSEPVRLLAGASRCAGTLEVKQGEWRPVSSYKWTMKEAAVACRELDCGSAASTGPRKESSDRPVWLIRPDCLRSGSTLRDCVSSPGSSSSMVELTCSDLLFQPIISVSPTMDGVSGAQQQGFQVLQGSSFIISCSVQPQYPGGSFQLTFTSSNTVSKTQPAVNHSADFLFPAADPAHQGNYSCVYGVYVFSDKFSSESRLLSLTVKVLETKMNASENAVEELKIQSAGMMTRLKICENEVEELKRQNADQPKVAFSLGLTDDRQIGPFNTDITLKFSKVITNFGRVYSPTTGVFTAPVRGAYYFSFNILDTRSNTWRDVYLYHNNKRVLTSHNYSVHSGESVSNSLVLQLEKGDVVYLVLAAGHTVYDDGNDHTFFNGFLLFPL